MTAAKMETAAERYRRIRLEKAKSEQLHDVDCPDCGMTWKARKISVDFWVTSGVLPLNLVETMLKAGEKSGGKPEDLIKSLATKEVLQSLEFSAKVIKATAVEPRIVDDLSDANDVTKEDVLPCCFKQLLNWQMKGGAEAERLGNFPAE